MISHAPFSIAVTTAISTLVAAGCSVESPSSTNRIPFRAAPTDVLEDLQKVGIADSVDDFSQLKNFRTYQRPLARWNLEISWQGRSLAALAYWPRPLGGLGARWQTMFPAFLDRAGEDFAGGCGSECTSQMSQIREPPLRRFLQAGGVVDGLSPLEKAWLSNLSQDETQVQNLLAATRDGTDLRLTHVMQRSEEWWTGYCHALPLASALFPMPPSEFVEKGIRFFTPDIAALALHVADRFQMSRRDAFVFFGTRADSEHQHDAIDDLNPATAFLVLANLARNPNPDVLLVMDGEPGPQVWNQAIVSHSIQVGNTVSREKVEEVYATFDASAPLAKPRTIAEGADTFVGVVYTVRGHGGEVRTLEAMLELDGDRIVGGEWIGLNAGSHPDFFWLANHGTEQVEAFERALSKPVDREVLRLVRKATSEAIADRGEDRS